MQGGGGIRRGLHIDQDDETTKYQYQGFDAGRKKNNTQKDLDDMFFGSRKPVRRGAQTAQPAQPTQPAQPVQPVQKEQVKPTPSQQRPRTDYVNKSGDANKSAQNFNLTPAGGANQGVNRSTTINQGKATGINQSATITKKEPSIIKDTPYDPRPAKESTGGTLPVISKPDVQKNNYVQPPSQPSQPTQVHEETITIEAVHGFGKRNKHNKPGYLRKGKKVAENFKFAEENVVLHSAVDVVRPFQTDRARQRKLNDFDFHDFEFPAQSVCLGPAVKASIWKKPKQVSKIVNFGKYVDPNDLSPGSLSSPQFLSAVSGLAELEANTKRLIEDQEVNSNGFYLVRLFVNSVWRYVTVDSLVPFVDGEHAGVTSYDGDFDLQAALIEKAYAKSFGSYEVFDRAQPREYYLRDLTGAPVRKYPIDHPDVKNVVTKALSSGQVVQVVPTEKIAALGVNPNYSYSVINFSNKGIELRNSWGTLEERSKLSFRSEGNFELSAGQLRDNISHIVVTNIHSDYFTTTVQSRHRLGFHSTYSFKLRNKTHGFLTVSQWDERLFPSSCGYEYSPASIILQKNNEDGSVEFINANHTINGRNLDLEVNLEAGSYTAFAAISWKGNDQSFNLSFYGSQRVDFSRVHTDKDPCLISKSLQDVNVSSGKKTDSKTSVQYTSYNEESNCILITVENSSNRDSKCSIDLSRAKLDNVNLISGHSNQENYSEKVSYEIDDYKQNALTDRRWNCYLEPGHRFTWVLAAKSAYNEGNARAWGFL